MTPLKELPADRQAVLSLLVKQRRSYEQVAGMLKIEESAVRGRAMDAVSALGGAAPEGLDDADRERIGDYLLGQLSESERIETLALLLDTSSGRAWARRVSAELAPIAGGGLPAVPDDLDEPAPEPTAAATRATADAAADQEPSEADAEGDATPARSPLALGVLAVAAALIIAAIVVFATSSGGSSPLPTGPIPASAATATTASTTTGSTTGGATGTTGGGAVSNEVSLRATSAGGKATGAAAVLTSSGQKELAFTAQNLASPPAGEHYVLWLYNSASQFEALGEIATVSGGKVSPVAVALPADASTYTGIVVTLESSSAPTKPGTIILAGTSSTPF
jgi:hypothetical protein